MGWSNVGAVALFTTQVNLVDSTGNTDGFLNGLQGLVLFFNSGTPDDPNFQVTPSGDMIFGGLAAATGLPVTAQQGIEAGGVLTDDENKERLFIYFNSGSVSNQGQAFVVPVAAPEDGSEGAVVMLVPIGMAQDPATASDIPFGVPETWHDVTFANGWTNAGGTANVQCRLDVGGMVIMRGRCKPGTTTDGTTIFTLPAAYRPTYDAVFDVAITAAADPASPTRIVVNPSGAVQIFGAGSALTVSLNGIFWDSSLLSP